jgi:hypothetical protein
MVLKLKKGLEASYLSNPKEAKTYLSKEGYVYDDKLSNVNSKVYYNPDNKDLLIAYRGSKNILNDWLTTDLAIPFGGLRNTKRYNESLNVYKKAKNKYHVDHPTLIGDSLGGSLASAVGGTDKKSKIYSFNKGTGLFGNDTNNKSNEVAFRQSGDVVSGISVFNHNKPITLGARMDPLSAHNINNLEKYNINIYKKV